MNATRVGAPAAARIDELLHTRGEANAAYFEREADRLARLCHRMAERFAKGGRLVAFGATPAARSDARHVAVEFVHPVIVGKRALPALGLAGEGGPLAAQVELEAEAGDIAIAFGGEAETLAALAAARERGCLTIAFTPSSGAQWEFDPAGVSDPFVRQELVESAYHVLWELVHVFFDHRGLLEGRTSRPVHDVGASSFLYPFLGEQEQDLEAVVADVAASVRMKADEVNHLRAQTLGEFREVLVAAAGALRESFAAGGRLLALGNGGSATDAMDVVADFRTGVCGGPPRRALDLTEDAAILTAIANDIGLDAIFSRQIIAHGRPGDVLLALSTSGNSVSVLAALVEARKRGLVTIAMVGYDGGRVLADDLADHVIVSRSEHIPRIQEAQASAYHVLRELVELDPSVVGVTASDTTRVRARVYGTVQGVGYRPFAYRLARELDLVGYVRNDERGVVLEAEGPAARVDEYLARLQRDAPPLARVERVESEPLPPLGERDFQIQASAHGGAPSAPVAPDSATCEECLAELVDPHDRRFRYPFVNCTNCGPRFSIVRGVPYDRPLTTMVGFAMCARCQAEYDNPMDRRFHAQPNACPDCGPRARLVDADGRDLSGGGVDAVAAAAASLRAGRIMAVKGIGGYHLACRADDERAVARLRARKVREERPFALMVADLDAARALVRMNATDEDLLRGPERPILLATRRRDASVARSVAPSSPELGVMLPYSPLHYLLLRDGGFPLVMTSANRSDEPIAYRDDDALARLAGIADEFLVHDRPIETRTDDSVVRTVRIGATRRALMLRRSRGYVPVAIDLPHPAARPILGMGAELKSTFCLAKGPTAWVGHHIGDLRNDQTLLSFREGIAHFERLFAVTPEVVAHDLHPDYLSTREALDHDGVELVGVQHHHAHLAACLAEHGHIGAAVGAIFDGTGYGTDGTIWGGELLIGGVDGFRRVGHLRTVHMPGGEAAIREPWRMACAWLVESIGEDPTLPQSLAGDVDPDRWATVARLATTGFSSPLTSSMGRLFDAVAALCGVRAIVNYEGQAAIEFEALADRDDVGAYPMPVTGDSIIDPRETIQAVVGDLARGTPLSTVSARFHAAVAAATAAACVELALRGGLDTVALAGGVFQNTLLLERTALALEDSGLRVLVPERLPPNDGAIAFGQVVIAARMLARRQS